MTRALRPRLAASVIVTDTSGGPIRLLMGRRSDAHAFMPGFHVFPGGAYERGDRRGPALLTKEAATRTAHGLPARQRSAATAQALARTAARELAEETGHSVMTDAPPGVLVPLARAITPPGQVRRYDTRFFVADAASVESTLVPPDDELLDIGWITLPVAQSVKIHPITAAMITEVSRYLDGQAPGYMPCYRMRHGKPVVEMG